jgi:uncharacterized membrane-anchored protein YjiN (DUF445 family)
MIEFMKEGLPEDKKKILETTDAMIGTLNKPELKNLKKERSSILSYLGLLFNEVGRQAFTDEKWSNNSLKKNIERKKRIAEEAQAESGN